MTKFDHKTKNVKGNKEFLDDVAIIETELGIDVTATRTKVKITRDRTGEIIDMEIGKDLTVPEQNKLLAKFKDLKVK